MQEYQVNIRAFTILQTLSQIQDHFHSHECSVYIIKCVAGNIGVR